jgi:hypothetical protein
MVAAAGELFERPDDGMELGVAGELSEEGRPFYSDCVKLFSSGVSGRFPGAGFERRAGHEVGEVIMAVGASAFNDFGGDEFTMEVNEDVFHIFGAAVCICDDGDVFGVRVYVAPVGRLVVVVVVIVARKFFRL